MQTKLIQIIFWTFLIQLIWARYWYRLLEIMYPLPWSTLRIRIFSGVISTNIICTHHYMQYINISKLFFYIPSYTQERNIFISFRYIEGGGEGWVRQTRITSTKLNLHKNKCHHHDQRKICLQNTFLFHVCIFKIMPSREKKREYLTISRRLGK